MKKYKIIFILSIIACIFFNIAINYINIKELPSNDWSRSIEIKSYEINDHTSATYKKILDKFLFFNDTPYYLFFENKKLHLTKVSNNFNDIQNLFTIDSFIDINSIDMYIHSDIDIDIYTLDKNKKLSLYNFDGKIATLIGTYENINYVKFFNGSLYYLKDDTIFINDEAILNDVYSKFDIDSYGNNTIISYLSKDINSYKFNMHYKSENSSYIEEISSIPKTPNISISNIYVNTFDSRIDLFLQLSNSNNTETTIRRFSKENYFPGNIKEVSDIKINCFNKDIISRQNNIIYSAIDENYSGYPNVYIESYNDLNKKRLTISKKIKFNIDYFELDNYKYLKWDEIHKDNIVTYVSSDNPEIIRNSLKLNMHKLIDIIMNSLSSYLPLFYLILIPFTGFFIPVVIFVMIMSLINLSKLENDISKTVILLTIVHNISKLIFFIRNVIVNEGFINSLPSLLQSTYFVIIVFVILIILGLLFLRQMLKEEKNYHFFKYYIYYLIFDLLTFSMIFYTNFA